MNDHSIKIDTIIALSTPPGRGGIGIIRISGKLVPNIASKVLGKIPEPRKAEYLPFLLENGTILEHIIALFFPAPHSFTGENILEIHGHGGQIILNLILERILQISATDIRIAHPGEFTERAFLNNKIDLIQAEAIADIIDATSHQAAKSASNSLQGIFSKKIHSILKKITNLRTYVELSIDFSEEIIDPISYVKIENTLNHILNEIQQIFSLTRHGVMLREGIKIVIAGNTNAGKSSLFNALIGLDRAIVSTISGTTRDTLHESIQLNGIAYHITDTAGLQKNSHNEIEKIGINRTWQELKQADHILWVIDSNHIIHQNQHNTITSMEKTLNSIIYKKTPITIIRNKSDLSLEKIGINTINNYTTITLSALSNDGIDLLRTHLTQYNIKNEQHTTNLQKTNIHCINHNNEIQSNFIARRRHLDILEKSQKYLTSAQNQLVSNSTDNTNTTTYTNHPNITELFAEDLKLAHYELNKIFGKFTSDDLLKKIFSTFCIGK